MLVLGLAGLFYLFNSVQSNQVVDLEMGGGEPLRSYFILVHHIQGLLLIIELVYSCVRSLHGTSWECIMISNGLSSFLFETLCWRFLDL